MQDMDPLDETRIHPLQYNVATALCKAAWLAEQDLTAEEANEDDLEMAVQEIAGALFVEVSALRFFSASSLVPRLPYLLSLLKRTSVLVFGFQGSAGAFLIAILCFAHMPPLLPLFLLLSV